jgi:hypothetical protein
MAAAPGASEGVAAQCGALREVDQELGVTVAAASTLPPTGQPTPVQKPPGAFYECKEPESRRCPVVPRHGPFPPKPKVCLHSVAAPANAALNGRQNQRPSNLSSSNCSS